MADEKIFTIPLRKEFSKKPIYRRAKKAVTCVKEFIIKHLKVKEAKIGPHLNEKIWERGRRHPLPIVKVKAIVEDNVAYVELPGFKFEKTKKEESKEEHDHKGHSHETHDVNKAEAHQPTKEQEKELKKDLEKEEIKEQKKEHLKVEAGTPDQHTKPFEEKGSEAKAKRGRAIGSSGKKGAKDSKP